MFSHGEDLANMILSSYLPHKACTAIINTPIDNHDPPFSISIQEFSLPDNAKIIAFRSSPKLTVQELKKHAQELEPSNEPFFNFIPTEVNPYISKAAVHVFNNLADELNVLQDKIDISKPLLVTGNSFAGSIASLFTLWLLDSVYKETSKRPTCITFGSPLLGDINFQKAIHQNSSWHKCFLHVALSQDPIPKLFISSTYKPFGSFLFCSDLRSACFNQPKSVFDVIVAMSSLSIPNMNSNIDINNYKSVLDELKSKVIYKGKSELGDYDYDPLRVGIVLQLEAIGLIQTQQQEVSNEIKALIEKLVKGIKLDLMIKKNIVDRKRKLNEIKIYLTYLEWYKKVEEKDGCYYDGFKRSGGSREQKIRKGEIDLHRAILKNYWIKEVQEADEFPQNNEKPLHTSSLYSATTYRRMVEPLDIADYYKHGNTDYINSGRHEHYRLLEKWFHNDKGKPSQSNKSSLTEDSCFWAHVEEAVISLVVLKNGESTREDRYVAEQKLIAFEHYVFVLTRTRSVSTEIFSEKSTYMNWWKEYEQYKGPEYKSELTTFMKDELQMY